MIPNHLYTNIFKYIDFGYIVQYLRTCKNNRQLLIYAKKNIESKKKYIEERFCSEIIDLIGNINHLIAMPILPWNNRFVGGTDYIDCISKRDLDTCAMIGQDCYKRAYIVFRVKYDTKKKIIVLFQRYTSEDNTWASASDHSIIIESGHFMCGGRITHKLLKNNIQNLVNNKNFITVYKEYFSDELTEKRDVYLV